MCVGNVLSLRGLWVCVCYMWVLDNVLAAEMNSTVEQLALGRSIVFLENTTSEDVADLTKRLSHAAMIKAALLQKIPQ